MTRNSSVVSPAGVRSHTPLVERYGDLKLDSLETQLVLMRWRHCLRLADDAREALLEREFGC